MYLFNLIQRTKSYKWLLFLSKARYLVSKKYFFRLNERGGKVRTKLCDVDAIYQNEFYGIGPEFRKFLERAQLDHVYIEHGYYLYTLPDEYQWPAEKYLCISPERAAQIFLESGRKALAVGPYVHYVTKEIAFHPKGNYLLYIPIHEIDGVVLEYDEAQVIRCILEVASKFKLFPVVCLYYQEYENASEVSLWQRRGFHVVTCGSRYDLDHLAKAKSLIGNAKLMITNGFGTHYIYALFLSTPTQGLSVHVQRKYSEEVSHYERLRGSFSNEISTASLEDIEGICRKDYRDIVIDTASARLDKVHFFGFDELKTRREIVNFLADHE